jgi:hypothetical protein
MVRITRLFPVAVIFVSIISPAGENLSARDDTGYGPLLMASRTSLTRPTPKQQNADLGLQHMSTGFVTAPRDRRLPGQRFCKKASHSGW